MPTLKTILRCMPKREDRMLPALSYTPVNVPTSVTLPIKHPKADADMMGPETVHNQLIYRQFGIIALGGGALRGAHYDVIRDRINKYVDFDRFFAIWRIEPPWKPVSKKSLGKKMGGGKTKVHHYELPVRPGRVLVELGGIGEFEEIIRPLTTVCGKLPLYAMPISQTIMDEIKAEKLELDKNNYNPFDYRYLVKNNFSNAQRYLSYREALWGGTFHF